MGTWPRGCGLWGAPGPARLGAGTPGPSRRVKGWGRGAVGAGLMGSGGGKPGRGRCRFKARAARGGPAAAPPARPRRGRSAAGSTMLRAGRPPRAPRLASRYRAGTGTAPAPLPAPGAGRGGTRALRASGRSPAPADKAPRPGAAPRAVLCLGRAAGGKGGPGQRGRACHRSIGAAPPSRGAGRATPPRSAPAARPGRAPAGFQGLRYPRPAELTPPGRDGLRGCRALCLTGEGAPKRGGAGPGGERSISTRPPRTAAAGQVHALLPPRRSHLLGSGSGCASPGPCRDLSGRWWVPARPAGAGERGRTVTLPQPPPRCRRCP